MGTYQPAFGRGAVLVLFGLLAASVVIAVAVDLIEGRLSWGFDGVFVAALVWNGYWWLLRIASSLSVSPDGVRWVAPASGHVVGSVLLSSRWSPASERPGRAARPPVRLTDQFRAPEASNGLTARPGATRGRRKAVDLKQP